MRCLLFCLELAGTSWNQPWHALAFEPLLMSLPLTKIGIIYTQLLQEEKTFLMLPRSEWSAHRSLNYAQKFGAKLSATIDGYSMITFACLNDAFSKLFELEASPVNINHSYKKTRKGEIAKVKKEIKSEKQKPKDVGHFLISKFWFSTCPSRNAIKCYASGKKGSYINPENL